MTQKRKQTGRFVYPGLGFPVELRNVELVKTLGRWAPDLNLNELADRAFRALATKPANLTGDEVRFVRQHKRMTLQAFADHFRVTRQAVMKWEASRDQPAGMSPGTELAIRLRALKDSGASAKEFFEAHSVLETLALEPVESVVMVYDPEDPDFSEVGFETPVPAARRAPHFKNR